MLVNKLLLSVSVDYNSIAVKALDNALELEAVCEDTGNGYPFFSCLIKENVLKI